MDLLPRKPHVVTETLEKRVFKVGFGNQKDGPFAVTREVDAHSAQRTDNRCVFRTPWLLLGMQDTAQPDSHSALLFGSCLLLSEPAGKVMGHLVSCLGHASVSLMANRGLPSSL